jgi:hypothetical protein
MFGRWLFMMEFRTSQMYGYLAFFVFWKKLKFWQMRSWPMITRSFPLMIKYPATRPDHDRQARDDGVGRDGLGHRLPVHHGPHVDVDGHIPQVRAVAQPRLARQQLGDLLVVADRGGELDVGVGERNVVARVLHAEERRLVRLDRDVRVRLNDRRKFEQQERIKVVGLHRSDDPDLLHVGVQDAVHIRPGERRQFTDHVAHPDFNNSVGAC